MIVSQNTCETEALQLHFEAYSHTCTIPRQLTGKSIISSLYKKLGVQFVGCTEHCGCESKHKKVQTLIYFNMDTQYAHFQRNPLHQATKQYLNNR